MILWINGPFGVGKTTLANMICRRMPDAQFIDTERIGYLLRPVLDGPRPVKNFQDWPAWRALVVSYLGELHDELGGVLVVPQSVFVEEYWREISSGLADRGIPVRAITLDVERDELERRIRTDELERGAVAWRLEHIESYSRALSEWMRRATEVVEAADSPDALAASITASLVASDPSI